MSSLHTAISQKVKIVVFIKCIGVFVSALFVKRNFTYITTTVRFFQSVVEKIMDLNAATNFMEHRFWWRGKLSGVA